MTLNFFQKSELLLLSTGLAFSYIFVLSGDFLISFVSSGQYQRGTFLHKAHWVLSMTFKSRL